VESAQSGLVVAVGGARNLTAYPIDFQDKDFALTRTFAAGTPSQVVGEMLKLMDGVDMVRVAYKGAGITVTGLASGAVSIFFSNVAGALPVILNARVTTSPQRHRNVLRLFRFADVGQSVAWMRWFELVS
jgi:hypothetical protein